MTEDIKKRLRAAASVKQHWTHQLLVDSLAYIEALEQERAALHAWLNNNSTFYDTAASDAPVLAEVSERIWYHATDDQESWPFSKVVERAMAKLKATDGCS